MSVSYMHLAEKRAYLFYRRNTGFANKLLISCHGSPCTSMHDDIFYRFNVKKTGVPALDRRSLFFYSAYGHTTSASLDDVTSGTNRKQVHTMKHVDYVLRKWQNSKNLLHWRCLLGIKENDQGENYGSIRTWMNRDANSEFDVITIRRRKKKQPVTFFEIMAEVNKLRTVGQAVYSEIHCSFCRGDK